MSESADKPKRKHVATGKKPPGGKREGAGRPAGTWNSLGYGEVKALKIAKLRVPDGASEGEAELAGVALGRMVDVMMDRLHPQSAGAVLKAATTIREEICKPIPKAVEVAGKDGGALVVNVVSLADEADDDG